MSNYTERTNKKLVQNMINELNKYYKYNPETGELIRIKLRHGANKKLGTALNTKDSKGYLTTQINYKTHKVHRLIWLLHHGSWPIYEIDHKDGNVSNNKIKNLRDVPKSINQQNKVIAKNNKSGVTGVRYRNDSNKWHARISVNSKQIDLGCFKNFNDAVNAREFAEVKYGFTKRHGL